ncbi:MAG: hypothetical protein RSD46_06975 [Oscillospiraceae bacterium]
MIGVGIFCFKDATVEKPAEYPEASADKPALILGPNSNGSISKTVDVGGNSANITVDFQYEVTGDKYAITAINGAYAKLNSGWQYVEHEASVNLEKVSLCDDNSMVSVPITYQASIGEGLSSYDCCILVDISVTQTP